MSSQITRTELSTLAGDKSKFLPSVTAGIA